MSVSLVEPNRLIVFVHLEELLVEFLPSFFLIALGRDCNKMFS
jgi:hypothetical protein